jgi:hypothetical protein
MVLLRLTSPPSTSAPARSRDHRERFFNGTGSTSPCASRPPSTSAPARSRDHRERFFNGTCSTSPCASRPPSTSAPARSRDHRERFFNLSRELRPKTLILLSRRTCSSMVPVTASPSDALQRTTTKPLILLNRRRYDSLTPVTVPPSDAEFRSRISFLYQGTASAVPPAHVLGASAPARRAGSKAQSGHSQLGMAEAGYRSCYPIAFGCGNATSPKSTSGFSFNGTCSTSLCTSRSE